MAAGLTRRRLEAWLLEHGFQRLRGKMSGHLHFERDGVKITVPGHGAQDLSKKHIGLIIRALVSAGFDREQLRRELLNQ
jgi:predicted RNA binding protein YcfA (HicA-like mRNA interferase family)